MVKPKYQRWPYGKTYNYAPRPTRGDFKESLEAIAKLIDRCVDEILVLEKMRERDDDTAYRRALAESYELRGALARWARAAESFTNKSEEAAEADEEEKPKELP